MYKLKFFYDRVIPYIFKYNRVRTNLYKMKFKSVGLYTILKYSPKYIEDDRCNELLLNRFKDISLDDNIEIQSFINNSIDIITLYEILVNTNKNSFLEPRDTTRCNTKGIEFYINAWFAESSKYIDILDIKDIDSRYNSILEFINKEEFLNYLGLEYIEFDYNITKDKGLRYIEGMLEIHMVKAMYKEIQESSEIAFNKHIDIVYDFESNIHNIKSKYLNLGDLEAGFTKGKHLEESIEIYTNKSINIEEVIEVSIKELNNVEPLIEIHKDRYKDISPITEINPMKYISCEFIGLPECYRNVSKFVESGIYESNKQNTPSGIETNATEYLKYISKFIEIGRYESNRNKSIKYVENTPNDIDNHYMKSAGGNIVLDIHKMISPPRTIEIDNALDILIRDGKYNEELVEVKVNSPKSTEVIKEIRSEAGGKVDRIEELKKYSPKGTDIIKEVYTNSERIVNTNIDVDYQENTYVSIKDAHDIYAPEYKAVKQGKLWRNVTGDMHDHIWLRSINEGFFFNELTKESKISFKAYLDFVLFLEQLIYVSRFFYAASRAKDAIDDMNRILSEWMTESRPSDEPVEEYENLIRLYKWYADEYYYYYFDKTELNGIVILTKIKDNMVKYFESRWGKRVVTYGADGMYIYSKDDSYIDRCRGHKHGSLGNLMTRETGKEIYGIDHIPTDIE